MRFEQVYVIRGRFRHQAVRPRAAVPVGTSLLRILEGRMATAGSVGRMSRIVLLTSDRMSGEALTIACRRRGLVIDARAPGDLADMVPDVLVLDARTTGHLPAEVAASVADSVGRVVVVGGPNDATAVPADAHVPMDGGLDDLVAAITDRGSRISSSETPLDPVGLTARESDVLRALVAGWGTAQMAEGYGISQRTVGTHLRNLYAKLGVGSRTEAAAWAVRVGIAPAEAAAEDGVSGRS
jgi:DNA-binding NarL/FixJ family response regulator